MRALTWHGKRDVRVDTVPDPMIRDPDDVIVKITTTGLYGSDPHLYEVRGAFLNPGDILGHEPMGIVEAVRDLTGGRGPDAVIDAVGMEAHGNRIAAAAQGMTTHLRVDVRGQMP